jgi:hypothetical protein
LPKKRPVETRLAEMEAKMEDLKLEKAILDMKNRRTARRPAKKRRR